MAQRKAAVSREKVVAALAQIAFEEPEAKLSERMKALELLGKHLGLFEGLGARELPRVEIREDIGN